VLWPDQTSAASLPGFSIATFAADVTPPIGHPLLAGLVPPAAGVNDPLAANGLVLLAPGGPIVLAAIDWCEIRNDAYDRWRAALAQAAGTTPNRVLVTSVHQHDAPLADLEAERILERAKRPGRICDLEFHEQAVERVAAALKSSLAGARPITHISVGQAKVDRIASNRRYLDAQGRPKYDRGSTTSDAFAREQPEGTVDPWLRSITFFSDAEPVAALSSYATHPMSYYRTGRISADFPGLARKRRQADDARVAQIYASGCSGNVTAGKYNDGDQQSRLQLAERLYQGIVAAQAAARRSELKQIEFRSEPLRLEPRETRGYTTPDLEQMLRSDDLRSQCRAAMGLSWRKRADAGHKLDVPVIDFGAAQLILLPGESYVEYQLYAQQSRPESFVMALGYGECAPGYIPIERAWQENDPNLNDWCWVAPGAEERMKTAIRQALAAK
jgi:hypothetical protein